MAAEFKKEAEDGIDQDVLLRLIDRLNSYPIGLPDTPEIREFLNIFLTKDEAYLASLFPLREATSEEMSKKAGWNIHKTDSLLNVMAEKGTVVDYELDGKTFWVLSPSVIGFVEFSLMKMHKGMPLEYLAKLLETYEEDALFGEVFGSKTPYSMALVGLDVPITSEVMTYSQVEKVIDNAGRGAVQTCYCRSKSRLLGKGCSVITPEETCISLGAASDFLVRRGFGKRLGLGEIKELVRELGKKGLIHITDNVREHPSFICNCCGCCCGLLAGVHRKRLSHAVNPSPYLAEVDSSKCEGCGLCAKKCQVFAIKVEGDVAQIDKTRCLGCGACVKLCKFDAISLVRRKRLPKVPKTKATRFARIAYQKGRFFPLLKASIKSKLHKVH